MAVAPTLFVPSIQSKRSTSSLDRLLAMATLPESSPKKRSQRMYWLIAIVAITLLLVFAGYYLFR